MGRDSFSIEEATEVVHHSDGIELSQYNNIPETQAFDKFVTIDRIADNRPVVLVPHVEREYFNKKYHGYLEWLWDRMKIFVTLTTIAITIGCFAGFIQIFTETLVNWKTGHCTRNWLLNKSFCCNGVLEETSDTSARYLFKRAEFECVEQGIWTDWSGHISPFFIFVVLSMIFGLISALMIKYIAPMATGSGISEIKVWVSGFEYQKAFLSLSTLIVKSIALPLTISSGLSIGKEGPSVHYAACCAFVVASHFLKDNMTFASVAQYLTAGSGAGVAVAFGAPIGGVLFGIEEIASGASFNSSTLWKSYYVALVAITTLKLINPFRNGNIVLFHVTYDRDWKIQEVPIFIFLGIFGGLYGIYVSKWNIKYVNFRKRYLSQWQIQEVLVLVLITSIVSYFNEFLKLDMTEGMGILFHECVKNDNSSAFAHKLCQIDSNSQVVDFTRQFFTLIVATIIRIHFVIVSYGARVPAGIFVPSMAVGASFGRAISLLAKRYLFETNSITPGAYAFLGAAAALCGITNLTLTVVVIMFELTGAFIYIIPTMIVVAMTRIILASFGYHGGISDQMVEVNGFPFMEEDGKEPFMSDFTAAQIMTKELVVLPDKIMISDLYKIIYGDESKIFSGYPIIRADDMYEDSKYCVGYVLRRHLIKKLQAIVSENIEADIRMIHLSEFPVDDFEQAELQFGDIINRSPVMVKPTIETGQLYDIFRQLGCKIIIIEESGLIEGVLTRKDILRFSRGKYRELEGPIYAFNENLNEKFFSVIKAVVNLFGKKI
ncbi:Anion/proton exchange transporter GEF1 [Nakaseomyces bracarensis]|uniref:Anion/proton exchange transporter GEF1 n=1 Tax=Nakaseomyces bracarensis TaxID=273131 RepID=A0ABR4NUK1_9SACH